MIGKDHKTRTGLSYHFYFRDSDGITPAAIRCLKTLLPDNLLGAKNMK